MSETAMPILERADCVDNDSDGRKKALILFAIGFAIVLVGVVIVAVAAFLSGGNLAGVDAVILIGPVPIVVGAGADSTWLILFGTILTVLSLAIFLVMRRRTEKNES